MPGSTGPRAGADAPRAAESGVVQIRVTPKTRNPFTIKALSISGVTWNWHVLNHALLEVEAAVMALPYVDAAGLAELTVRASAFESAVEGGTRAEQSATNLAFHDALYARSPNRALAELAIEARDRARLWPMVLWPSIAALHRSAEGHQRILGALRARDAAALAAKVRSHILGSAANDPGLG